MTIRAAISCYSADHVNPNGRIVASDYVDILGNQVHLVVQMLFPNTEATFQDDNSAILTARSVQSWFSGPRRSTSTSFLSSAIIHLVVCLTTDPKPLPKRALHIVRSRASSFK